MTQNISSAVMQQRVEAHDSLISLRRGWGNGMKRQPNKVLKHPIRPNRNGSLEDHVMAGKALHLAKASRQETQENWKPVEGWPGYEVSDQGRVRSWKQRTKGRKWLPDYDQDPTILKPEIRNGYCAVLLSEYGKKAKKQSVHRLVLAAFVGVQPSRVHAAHGNGIKTDNRLCNLRWATPSENNGDKRGHGTHQWGERVGTSKLTASDVREIRSLRSSGVTVREVAARCKVCRNTITNITQGHYWKGC